MKSSGFEGDECFAVRASSFGEKEQLGPWVGRGNSAFDFFEGVLSGVGVFAPDVDGLSEPDQR